jgi:hypothetical protein
LGDTGFEPVAKIAENHGVDDPRGTNSGTLRPTDPDLIAIMKAWPMVPEVLRAGILAMVKAAT